MFRLLFYLCSPATLIVLLYVCCIVGCMSAQTRTGRDAVSTNNDGDAKSSDMLQDDVTEFVFDTSADATACVPDAAFCENQKTVAVCNSTGDGLVETFSCPEGQ